MVLHSEHHLEKWKEKIKSIRTVMPESFCYRLSVDSNRYRIYIYRYIDRINLKTLNRLLVKALKNVDFLIFLTVFYEQALSNRTK